MTLQQILGTELPLIQAPMAGVQGSAMAVAVSNAAALGSLPCAMLTLEALRNELLAIQSQTDRPYNVNFFCHVQPGPMQPAKRAGGPRWRRTTTRSASTHKALPPAPAGCRSRLSRPSCWPSSSRPW